MFYLAIQTEKNRINITEKISISTIPLIESSDNDQKPQFDGDVVSHSVSLTVKEP